MLSSPDRDCHQRVGQCAIAPPFEADWYSALCDHQSLRLYCQQERRRATIATSKMPPRLTLRTDAKRKPGAKRLSPVAEALGSGSGSGAGFGAGTSSQQLDQHLDQQPGQPRQQTGDVGSGDSKGKGKEKEKDDGSAAAKDEATAASQPASTLSPSDQPSPTAAVLSPASAAAVPRSFSQWQEQVLCLCRMLLEGRFVEVDARSGQLLDLVTVPGPADKRKTIRGKRTSMPRIHTYHRAALLFVRGLAAEAQAKQMGGALAEGRLERLHAAKTDMDDALSAVQHSRLLGREHEPGLLRSVSMRPAHRRGGRGGRGGGGGEAGGEGGGEGRGEGRENSRMVTIRPVVVQQQQQQQLPPSPSPPPPPPHPVSPHSPQAIDPATGAIDWNIVFPVRPPGARPPTPSSPTARNPSSYESPSTSGYGPWTITDDLADSDPDSDSRSARLGAASSQQSPSIHLYLGGGDFGRNPGDPPPPPPSPPQPPPQLLHWGSSTETLAPDYTLPLPPPLLAGSASSSLATEDFEEEAGERGEVPRETGWQGDRGGASRLRHSRLVVEDEDAADEEEGVDNEEEDVDDEDDDYGAGDIVMHNATDDGLYGASRADADDSDRRILAHELAAFVLRIRQHLQDTADAIRETVAAQAAAAARLAQDASIAPRSAARASTARGAGPSPLSREVEADDDDKGKGRGEGTERDRGTVKGKGKERDTDKDDSDDDDDDDDGGGASASGAARAAVAAPPSDGRYRQRFNPERSRRLCEAALAELGGPAAGAAMGARKKPKKPEM